QDFSLSMYFRQAWRDPRLSYNHDEANNNKIRLMDESWNYFWVPDTYFRNEKSASFHKVTVNNRLINVNSSGHVWYVMRLTITLTCPMRLEMFPFDFQKCPIQFESFTNTMNDMFFGFLPKPVDLPDEIKPPQFQLLYYELVDCSSNYTSGAYPCAEISFTLQRDIGYYVIQVFIPSVLVVILSWVSFWINIDGVPARLCTLGLLTVLTITSATSSVNATLPRVSYIKAIDVWLIMCLIFVFCALLEYAFVNVAARNGVRIRTPIVRKAPLEVSPQPTAENLPPKTLPKPQMQTSASSYSYKQVCIDSDEGTDQVGRGCC
ncbi:hypothetical protein HELRODRAFT_80045, partial [Helobdella robusta]|uniref:Uncharacterized protein n=1 Tax=Helobdella robusta TaxID=6412 RepID=T1G3X0_HELRO